MPAADRLRIRLPQIARFLTGQYVPVTVQREDFAGTDTDTGTAINAFALIHTDTMFQGMDMCTEVNHGFPDDWHSSYGTSMSASPSDESMITQFYIDQDTCITYCLCDYRFASFFRENVTRSFISATVPPKQFAQVHCREQCDHMVPAINYRKCADIIFLSSFWTAISTASSGVVVITFFLMISLTRWAFPRVCNRF